MPELWGKRHENIKKSLEDVSKYYSEMQRLNLSFNKLNASISNVSDTLLEKEKSIANYQDKIVDTYNRINELVVFFAESEEKSTSIIANIDKVLLDVNARLQKII